MAEPFKDVFDEDGVRQLGAQLRGPGFDEARFVAEATRGLVDRELKGRVALIADAFAVALPPFPEAVELVRSRLPSAMAGTEAMSSGFLWWPLCTWVERHGLDHPALALELLPALTTRFSCEFAVRPYLREHPGLAWPRVLAWAEDGDPHVRRLASEGTRPRLPWGGHLKASIADPAPALPVLERLVDDPDEVVRRSVANHLGDIAKDHPDRAVAIAAAWLEADPARRPTVKHGLRYLVKHGHGGALRLMGYGPPQLGEVELTVGTPEVALGGRLELSLGLRSVADTPQPVRFELGIAFRGAQDTLRRPLRFRWSDRTLAPGRAVTLRRSQQLRDVTTRTHHAGEQGLVVYANGEVVAEGRFVLSGC